MQTFIFTLPVDISSVGNIGCQPHRWKAEIVIEANDLVDARHIFRRKMQSIIGEIMSANRPDYFEELTKND